MKVCVVKSGEKQYLCNTEFDHKKGDKVLWECGEENGWGEIRVETFSMEMGDYSVYLHEGNIIGDILGTFIPTKFYKNAVKKEPENRFKVWCETREERDEVLVALSLDGIGVNKPFDPFLLKNVPVGIHVHGEKVMLCRDRDVFDESDAPQKKLHDEFFFVNAEK